MTVRSSLLLGNLILVSRPHYFVTTRCSPEARARRDGFTHRPNRSWPGAPRNDLFYDDSMLTKILQNCAEA